MSEQKELTIVAPDGYEIDKSNSTFEKIVFKKKEESLPMSWEDLNIVTGYWSDQGSTIKSCGSTKNTNNKILFPSVEESNAMLAMAQLCQLRDAWNGSWKPNWLSSESKYVIVCKENNVERECYSFTSTPMCLKTCEMRNHFLNTFTELLEIAKPFL